jgi:hypothetical protein
MRSDFSAAEPSEIGLRLIGAGVVFAEGNRVIDAVHVVMGMQCIPAARFVGMNG